MERKKRQRKPAIEAATSNLPCEVIYTILSKLPAKSLMRFRCVCKPWLALISESQFIKSHLREAIKSDRQSLICSVQKSECFYTVDYETCGESGEELLYFPIEKYRKAEVLCSCNGLILLGLDNDKTYVLWNPSTREYKRFSCPYSEIFLNTSYGICYDSSIDDYKVLIISLDRSNYKYFMVFTWKTNSWTEIREFPYLMPHGQATVNGIPHWVVKGQNLGSLPQMHGRRGRHINNSPSFYHDHWDEALCSSVHCSSRAYAIIYFDLVEEKFKEMSLPNWTCNGNIFHLTVMSGCLSLHLYSRHDYREVDVWVMKEYGNRNSWTKLITIPWSVGSVNLYLLKPVCYTKKGEVVLMGNSTLVVYDPKERKLRNVKPSIGMRYLSSVISFVGSLVLPCPPLSS